MLLSLITHQPPALKSHVADVDVAAVVLSDVPSLGTRPCLAEM